ncbi:MAG: DUF1232 domain-containing protein [Candidatus Wallbacteria bacterium]|nr:DUF1232 domain-containing protein [Candidatus Wallbacteria bacterium]
MRFHNEKRIEVRLARMAERLGVSADRVEHLQCRYRDWEQRFRQHPLFEQLHAKVTAAWRFLQDPKVPKKEKALVLAAIGYVVMPVDLVPDWLPVVGLVDDLLAMGLALSVVDRHAVEAGAGEGQGSPEDDAESPRAGDDDGALADPTSTSN